MSRPGAKKIYLDEVQKYPDWSRAIKNIYDDYPSLHIVFTASSLLEILDARADLSRRAVVYHLPGLSFREYLNIQGIGLINSLYKQAPGIGALKKPDKLFLENSNLMYLLEGSIKTSDKGTVRETFFSIRSVHSISSTIRNMVISWYTGHIPSKSEEKQRKKQIRDLENDYVAADDIEYGHGKTTPLWLCGFLY